MKIRMIDKNDKSKWKFAEVKVGDEVVVRYGRDNDSVCKVTSVSPTMFSTGANKFRRSTGTRVGRSSGLYSATAEWPTPELRERIRHGSLARYLDYKSDWKKYDLAALEKIYDIVKTAEDLIKSKQQTT